MSNINKCEGKECPSKNSCFRYNCVDKAFGQSYSNFETELLATKEDKCSHYIQDKLKDDGKITRNKGSNPKRNT